MNCSLGGSWPYPIHSYQQIYIPPAYPENNSISPPNIIANCVTWKNFPQNEFLLHELKSKTVSNVTTCVKKIEDIVVKKKRKNKRKSKVQCVINCTSSTVQINDADKESGTSEHEIPREFEGDRIIEKFWFRRLSLFHRFHEGIKLDRESWFSVTPESVAAHIADKCSGDVVVDAFCGAGGNTIQFAKFAHKVIAIDIDPVKIELAKHNARVYGVEKKIVFMVGDFFELAATVRADVVFLSPPWGGPAYTKKRNYDIETMLKPRPASELMQMAQTVCSNVVMYLPRTSISDQLIDMAKKHHSSVEIEQCYLDDKYIAITAYYRK